VAVASGVAVFCWVGVADASAVEVSLGAIVQVAVSAAVSVGIVVAVSGTGVNVGMDAAYEHPVRIKTTSRMLHRYRLEEVFPIRMISQLSG